KPKPTPRPRTRNQKIPVVVTSTQDDSDDDRESTEESEVDFMLNLDSESTFTEDKDVDTRELTVEDVSMPTGDAQIHDVETVEIQQGSASTEQAEDISSDEEISFQNEEVLPHAEPTPPVLVRRSVRERRPPVLFTSGHYETSMAA
ncbi:hypothetical protein ACJMK2_024961, partial [Sinanodonta woodiana]